MCVRLGLEDLGKPDAVVGVAEDRGHDHVPRRARRRLVPDALKQEQLGAGDLAGQRLPMPGREERVLRAVDDERRRPHLTEPGPHVIGAIQEPVVARARPPVGRARDHTACRLAHRGLVEVPRSGVRAVVLDDVLDDRIDIVPVGLWRWFRERRPQPLGHGGQVVGRPRAGRDQRQRRHPLRVLDGQVLGDGAAHRQPHEMSAAASDDVDQSARVGDQVAAGVPGRPGGPARRAPRVTLVVADDEPPLASQQLAEVAVPAFHRLGGPGNEKDGGRTPLAKSLDAQVHPIEAHHLDCHCVHSTYRMPADSMKRRDIRGTSWVRCRRCSCGQ